MGTLHVTGLVAGQSITLPATIGYSINGLTIDASAGYRLRVQASPGGYHTEVPITASTGTVTLPADNLLSGVRTLSLTVLKGGSTVSAVATVPQVTIYGPK
jgi:hypothetical protein